MSQNPINPQDLLRELGVDDARVIEPVGGGWGDTSMWRVERAGRMTVLRVYPAQQRHIRDREVEVLHAVTAIPVPSVEATGDPHGHPAMLISWCPGTTLYEAIWSVPELAAPLGVELGRAQAMLHQMPVTDRLRSALHTDWIGWRGSQEDTLSRAVRRSASGAESLIHLDFHPLNVMVEGVTITGVIDWSNALFGDPRADIARTYSILTWMPFPHVVSTHDAARIRFDLRRGWLRGYCDIAGPPSNLSPFLAWAAHVMVRDLRPKIGLSGFWLAENDLERLRRRAQRWLRAAGIEPET